MRELSRAVSDAAFFAREGILIKDSDKPAEKEVSLARGEIIKCSDQLIGRKRKNLSLDKGRFQIGTLRKTAVYFSAPLTIAAFILMILLTVVTRIS